MFLLMSEMSLQLLACTLYNLLASELFRDVFSEVRDVVSAC